MPRRPGPLGDEVPRRVEAVLRGPRRGDPDPDLPGGPVRLAQRYPVEGSQLYLHGFSGGGQFVHRFFYLHPERLAALSIGTKGFEQRFGQSINVPALRRVPIQMVVGSEDVETWEIMNKGESNWMDDAEKTGTTRLERVRTLERNYLSHGLDVNFDLVEGVAHSGRFVTPVVAR